MTQNRPSATDTAPAPNVPDREMLEGFLDYFRGVIVRQLDGVDEADARLIRTESGMSLIGIVRHLAGVELWWFVDVLADERPAYFWSDADELADRDCDWKPTAEESVESVLDMYDAACTTARASAARFELDDLVTRPDRKDLSITLRWIYVHMIEEVARHAGHADIFRESIDGTVGTR